MTKTKAKSLETINKAKEKAKKESVGEENYLPQNNWVVLKLTQKRKTKIILQGEKAPEELRKTVVSVGPKVTNKALKPGVEVELPNRAMVQILPKLDGVSEYATLLETDIIGIYKDGE